MCVYAVCVCVYACILCACECMCVETKREGVLKVRILMVENRKALKQLFVPNASIT